MKKTRMLALVIPMIGACTEALPTQVEPVPAELGTADVALAGARTAEVQADALGGIDDALDRIIPALTDPTAARPLEAALAGLRTALAMADASGVPAVVDATRAAVDRYARTGLDQADLDAIRLALDYTEETIRAAN